jgi:GNAT superfamily N-acetyltransferase
MTPWRIEPLADHDRRGFESGSAELDRYFAERVGQDIRRRLAHCFVLVDEAGAVTGYYTLSVVSVAMDKLAPERAKKLPRYPTIPAALLGRLAVAKAHQGKRLGGALVADALLRAGQAEVMCYAMLVEAKDETAARFFEHLGFERLGGSPLRLVRPLR